MKISLFAGPNAASRASLARLQLATRIDRPPHMRGNRIRYPRRSQVPSTNTYDKTPGNTPDTSCRCKSAARISRIWAALSGLPIPSPARPRRVRWGQTCSEIKYRALLTIPPRLGYSRTDRLSRQDCCQRVNRVLKFKYNIKHI